MDPLHVLIVEDSENDALLLLHQLQTAGFTPTHRRVEAADELRSALAGASWDIVLSDYNMPQFNGLDALEIVQETDIDLPFIIISGAIGEDLAVEAMRAGVRDYLMKNNLKKLGPTIRRELREARIRRERRLGTEKIHHLNCVLRAIRNVHQHIVREADPAALIEKTCREMVSTRGFLSAWAYLTPEAPGGCLAYERGCGDAFPALVDRLKAGDLPEGCRRAFENSGAVRINDYSTSCAGCTPGTENGSVPERRVSFTTRLRHSDTHYGFLCVSASEDQTAEDEEESLLAEVGSDIGLALYGIELDEMRGRAEAELTRKQRTITLNNEIAGVFLTSPSGRIHADVLGVLCEALESQCGFFGYVDDAGDLVCPAITPEMSKRGYVADKDTVFPLSTWGGKWGRSLQEKQTVVINGGLGLPFGREHMKCAMAVPIVHHETLIGQFFLADKAGGFDDHDRELLESAAAQTAPVLSAMLEEARRKLEHEKLEDQFRQSQKMEAVGRLAGGIAHDFNNLLTVINGYAGFALEELRDSDPLHTDIQQIQGAGQRAAALTRQLLAFSRKQVMEPKVLDQNEVVANLEKLLSRLIKEDVELRITLADDLGLVCADPGQIEQVLMNLVVNASDAMPKGGKLTIETANVELDENYARICPGTKTGPYVMLSVTDNGIGMDAETRAQIFEPFFTTKEKGSGTGLGLATVYGIVKQSEGDIRVFSELDRGTTFKVYLPRVSGEKMEPESEMEPMDLGGAETILLVEDDSSVRDLVRRILEPAGYKVITAANGGEALLFCERHEGEIHLILTDVVMPLMSGRELADRLAGLNSNLKVLYMSGYTDDAIGHHGVLEQDTHFIAKPFTAPNLLRMVRAAMEDDRPFHGLAKAAE